MAKNKRQHFVPQFYLRNFAERSDRRSISLCSIASETVVSNAPIKGQCYKDSFYGADGIVERMLSEVEGLAAGLIQAAILRPGELGVSDRTKLISFFCLQRARTEAAVKHADEMAADFARQMKEGGREGLSPEMEADLYEDNIGSSLRNHMLGSPLLFDLKTAVVVNETKIEFITTDNPACVFNPAWKILNGVGGYGLGSSGLIIGMPLSPSAYFIAYDSRVYTSPGNNGVVKTSRIDDVYMLNKISASFALKNLYFRNGQQSELVINYARETADERNAPKSEIAEYFEDGEGSYRALRAGDPFPIEGKSIAVTSNRVFQIPVRLSFLSIRGNPGSDNDGSARGPVRDMAWAEIHSEFSQRVGAGFLVEGGIHKFARDHVLYSDLKAPIRRAI